MKSPCMHSNFIVISLFVLLFLACAPEKVEQNEEVDICAATRWPVSLDITQTNCSNADGAIVLDLSQMDLPVTYTLSNGPQNNTGIFEGLSAGAYTIKLSNSLGCDTSILATISNLDGVEIESIAVEPAGCGTTNGSVEINATSGTPPYNYQITGAAKTVSNIFSNLSIGSYQVTVSDEAGCEFVSNITIQSGVSLSEDIMPTILSSCATSSCHGGNQSPSLKTANDVIANASKVYREMNLGKMPPTGKLPASQISPISCWISDGTPNN